MLLLVPYFVTFTHTMIGIYEKVYDSLGWQAMTKVAETNLAVIYAFVLISVIVLTMYRLFQSKDLPFLISLPIGNPPLFWLKFLESLEDMGRSLVLPLPLLIAFSFVISKAGSGIYVVTFIIGLIGIMFQITSLSMIIALVTGKITSRTRLANISRGIAIVSALVILMIFMKYSQNTGNDITKSPVFGMSINEQILSLIPTTWLINTIPFDSDISTALIYALCFVSFTAILIITAYIFFKQRFYKTWMEVIEVDQKEKTQRVKTRDYKFRGLTQSFILKEVRTIKRDSQMIIGLLVPLIMTPIFLLFKDQDPKTQILYIAIISLVGTAAYTLSSIGREGRSFALLRSLPIKISVILRAKFIISFIVNFFVTFFFVLLTSALQRISLERLWHNVLVAVVVSFYLSGIGMGVSALFPKFDFTNPLKAVLAPGLYAFYLITILFVGTMVMITYTQWFYTLIAMIFWAVVALVLLRLGQKRLEKIDI
jgi:ABC-2 type transport system permease protein